MSQQSDRTITIFICTTAILFGIAAKIMPGYFYKQGKMYLDKKEYVKAYINLKRAYTLDKKNKDYRYYFVKDLNNLTPSVEVQKLMFEIASSEQDDSARQLAESKVSEWKYNVLRNIGDNYIEQVPLDNGILRWDIKSFPLKIYISKHESLTVPDYYFTEIKKAFYQWQKSNDFIEFTEAENFGNADIIVNIAQLPSGVCNEKDCKYVVGYTTPSIKGNTLKTMTITLYDKDPNGNFFSDKELYNTILHEIGHALGIMGHSYSSEDLMYMSSSENNNIYTQYRSSFQYLSSKDINTIKLLYKLLPTVTNSDHIETKNLVYAPIVLGTSKEISNRKVKEAQNYIKNAPDLASGYIDLAIAYSELGKNKEAIKYMLQGYERSKTNDEKYSSAYNLATLYLNSKDYESAIKYAEIAKEISNNEEIKELIMNINRAKPNKKI